MAEDPTIPILNIKASELPLILVGPILRRVEKDSVSVFVVLSRKVEKIELIVLHTINPFVTQTVLMGETTYIPAMGTYFFPVLITATSAATGLTLAPRFIYQYNLGFTEDGFTRGLIHEGVMVALGDTSTKPSDLLAYGGDELPSFVAPVTLLDQLNIVHGSCRKPHGGKIDAMMGLDVILDRTHSYAEFRPQVLILTGDQIYADDVADVVSYLCQKIMPVILGYDEVLPTLSSGLSLDVGKREKTVSTDAGFTSTGGYGKSHSIHFADFCGLYCLAWSNVFWPKVMPTYLQVATPTKGGTFAEELLAVSAYSENMIAIRKILANISVLTMFDDHEVCDDWFLHRRWTEKVLNLPLGKRILQNGLSAYAIFQAWGNTPEYFAQGTVGREILDLLTQLPTNKTNQQPIWDSIVTKILPTLNFVNLNYSELTGGMRWDYAISYGSYMILALNTRTNRGFAGTDDLASSSLLSNAALKTQVENRKQAFGSAELLILVSGAPVFGFMFIEEIIQPLAVAAQPMLDYVWEPESLTVETGESVRDSEAWAFHRHAFEALLNSLVDFGRVMILSGDVHYAFSILVNYWDRRLGATLSQEKHATFIQLTSSALKNTEFKTRNMTILPNDTIEYLGYKGRAYTTEPEKDFVYPLTRMEKHINGNVVLPEDKPDWEYRTTYLEDKRDSELRGEPDFFNSIPGWEGPTLGIMETSRLESTYAHFPWEVADEINAINIDSDRRAVGEDNIGQVILTWSSSTKTVKHYLWSNPTFSDYFIQPYTLHETAFDVATSSQTNRPSDAKPL